ncbi:toll/interleukin-1 receptor domain-containing protein [Nostoc sp. FACHB-190]|uniref:toll/interleukin-1 receptor domain-containing protein n=1 Tax=Nostoc sp. FACHB-190 TaxID=2692838 RepID=UPI001685E212|nr:toll/interleukin-1 receptor domain-containing protein [Nostoc sp. FACHB-190]MBD2302329.1 toll/interleukin-1 receptor domain-containing protein [Nostoc sp. FACHB-190]
MFLEGYSSIEPLGGFKDKGRDAIYVSPAKKTTIFAYSVREDWRAKLGEDAFKIKKHGHTCDNLVFITTAQPTAGERDEAIAYIRNQYGWDLEIYGSERLRILLETKYPHIKKNYPSIFPAEFIIALEQINKFEERKHLFISYAPEDLVLADWLAKRLTAEGYLVWCEHLKLLGGEKFPDDIEKAIKNQAFCIVALYSQPSLTKPDLILQRSIAINLIEERQEDFLIPIDVDGINKTSLDRKTQLLKFIEFNKNWAEGLKKLLNKLEYIKCPKSLPEGAKVSLSAFLYEDAIVDETENVFSNYLTFQKIPSIIYLFEAENPSLNLEIENLNLEWSYRQIDSKKFLSFHQPPAWISEKLQLNLSRNNCWQELVNIEGISTKNLVSELLRKALIVKCHQKGLKYCFETKLQYFPQGLAKGNRLNYIKYDGSKSFVQAVGTRTYWRPAKAEEYQYHLAPTFYISQNLFNTFTLQIRIRIRLGDSSGIALDKRKAVSRRKHLCKNWWNNDWLNRIFAVCQFLADDNQIIIGDEVNEQILIHAIPTHFTAPIAIDEASIKKFKQDRLDLLNMRSGSEQEDIL